MPEQDFNREEKREEREICFAGHAANRPERAHGKVYRWFDNFWYHHKWKTVIIAFVAVVLLVCTLQMCRREEPGDIGVMLVGPYNFYGNEQDLSDLQKLLELYLPADHDGDGQKKVDIRQYTVFSEEQIKAFAAQNVQINTADNANNYRQAITAIQTGDCSVLFLDPQFATDMKAVLQDVGAMLGENGAGGFTAVVEDKTLVVGVRLGDTAVYRENTAMQVLPKDTVICLARPMMGGKSDDEAVYAQAKEYYEALLK